MACFVPRPYQREIDEKTQAAFAEGARTAVNQLPTGSGKTATVSMPIQRVVARGGRVVFAAHLDSLLTDTHKRLTERGIYAGFVQAGRASEPLAPVQVCSLQTLHARGARPPADLVVLDECHRAMASTVRAILAAYPHAYIIGLTATPQRGDGQPLGDEFERLICGPMPRWLTAQGYLVPCDIIADKEPSDALISEPVDAYRRWTPGTRAIVFSTNIAHGEWLVHGFNAFGIPAALVTGETPRERRDKLREALRAGEILVLVSVQVFVEGWDEPSVETVILAREFSVTGAFLQAIGRGLRPSPATGKQRCTIIDLRGAWSMHGLPDEDRLWSLDGKPKRTEKLPSLQRCDACAAIFRPASVCPRCGTRRTVETSTRLPRVLSRDERLERLSDMPQSERDRRYLSTLVRIGQTRRRMPPARAKAWAMAQFKRQFGRAPQVTA